MAVYILPSVAKDLLG